jgi:hypothetical protein
MAIVTYTHRYKRPPRKRKAAAITPPIVKAPSKGERIRRREAADKARESWSPEEEAKLTELVRRMMRPPRT